MLPEHPGSPWLPTEMETVRPPPPLEQVRAPVDRLAERERPESGGESYLAWWLLQKSGMEQSLSEVRPNAS